MEPLKKSELFSGAEGPVVLVIMDGVGVGKYEEGDMVLQASTPNLNWLYEHAVCSQLKAHGLAVGLPSDDDMGNSEVGHNAIGCGRVFDRSEIPFPSKSPVTGVAPEMPKDRLSNPSVDW